MTALTAAADVDRGCIQHHGDITRIFQLPAPQHGEIPAAQRCPLREPDLDLSRIETGIRQSQALPDFPVVRRPLNTQQLFHSPVIRLQSFAIQGPAAVGNPGPCGELARPHGNQLSAPGAGGPAESAHPPESGTVMRQAHGHYRVEILCEGIGCMEP